MKKTLQTMILLLMAVGFAFGQVKVTVSVNVSNETVDASGVHVAGNWDPANEWNPSAFPMNDMGNGIWELDLTVAEGATFEYKFLLGNDWSLGNEGLNDKSGCIVGNGNTNRILSVESMDMSMSTVCYNSCGACVGAGQTAVTFKVDLSQEGVVNSPIYVSGSFPEMWNEAYTLRDDNKDLVYSTTLVLDQGDYNFKYRNGANGWESVPAGCAENDNRKVSVGADEVFLDVVCINKCETCVAVNTINVKIQVDMTNVKLTTGISANGVSIAGDFQSAAGLGGNWSPGTILLTDDNNDNVYEIDMTLPEGDYQFKFLNGNAWGTEESVPVECQNPGSTNRLMSISGAQGSDVTVGPFCYSSCDGACPALKEPVNVTFKVDMSNEFLAAEGLFISGDFIEGAKWDKDSIKMEETSISGIYAVTYSIRPGSKYVYKYFNNGMDSGQETGDFIAGGCGVDNGFGGSNRELDLKDVDSDITVTTFVFNSCDISLLDEIVALPYAENIKTFPNPTSNAINFDFGSNVNLAHSIEIYSLTGQKLISTLSMNNQVIKVNIEDIQNGLYFARITNERGEISTIKFIKE